jgi:hypothetical protein
LPTEPKTFHPVRILPGHRVASGGKGDPRFPGGTLRMQAPFFRELGLDLSAFHMGTLNVSLAPRQYRVVAAKLTFRGVKWHPTEPAEDFSFFDAELALPDGSTPSALVYYPHPETKPEHFQQPDVLEVLAPHLPGLSYGMEIGLYVPRDQIIIELPRP